MPLLQLQVRRLWILSLIRLGLSSSCKASVAACLLQPSCCRADIVPSRYVNPAWAAYPPSPEKLGEVYELVRALSADHERSPSRPCVTFEHLMRTGPMSCTPHVSAW